MPLVDLAEAERYVIDDCLRAAVTGRLFPMWEFQTLFGLDHQAVADIAFGPRPLDDAREDVKVAINNALNWLTGYPHGCDREEWERNIRVPPAEVRRILKKWKGTPTRQPFVEDVFGEML